MWRFIKDFGVLRGLLALASLMVSATSPWFGEPDYSTWGFFPTIVAPTLVVLLLFVLPLEMTMTRIFMLDQVDAIRRRLGRILLIELGLYGLLILSWLPLLRALLLAEPVV